MFQPILLTQNIQVVPLTQVMQSPASYTRQSVSVRGFLYQAADGRWILSTAPGLKTCCVGSAERADEQMEVFGQLIASPIGTVVVLQGRIEGSASRIQLHEASLVVEPHNTVCVLCLVSPLILLGLAIFMAFLARSKRKSICV